MMKKLKLQSNSSTLLYIQILKVTVLVILYLLVSMFSLSAQTPRKESGADGLLIKHLKIGDTIPQALWDIQLNVVGHQAGSKQLTLRDYKNKKLIILDFWATWCSSCIASFPSLYKLQDDMDSQVKVLSVTYQDRVAVEKFIGKSEFIQTHGLANRFSSIVNDKLLTKFFDKDAIPFTVCIDNNGVVRALAMPSELNALALKQMIKDRNAVPVAAKVLSFDQPLLQPYYDAKIINYYYSTLLPYGQGISQASSFTVDSTHQYKHLVVPNLNVFMQYGIALQDAQNYIAGLSKIRARRILEIKSPDSIIHRLEQDRNFWKYTYESVSPAVWNDYTVYKKMESDLNFYLGMKASYQLRDVECLVMRRADGKKPRQSKELAKVPTVILNGLVENDGSSDGKFLQKAQLGNDKPKNAFIGVEIKNIPNLFNLRSFSVLPFMIDETGLDERIDLPLSDNLSDIDQLKQAFAVQGLTLSLERRKMIMFVLTQDGFKESGSVMKLTRYGYVAKGRKELIR
ncbi:TlpA family protein disulfide reductase [Sphingobacterium multivorum]|uniref:Thiol-disulfide oxidoreductase n=2 Tax=Sphingobacteriaceae TaxID=84566 RepID=A0A654DSK8_SPHMU|nr:TlpA disulfide reductase family protein [Sphingobacterium multivorum]VXD08466.1 Thiol-disulfide oxidoreductase [Sphingobacterium multivorum]